MSDHGRILRVLHVGVANRGTWPLDKCDADTGFAPAALCDLSPAALEQARGRTGLTASACYDDLDAALAGAAGEGVDCAILCVPTVHHAPMALKAVRAGLAVLVEKGMAPDWPTARRFAAAVAEAGALACVAQNYRYNPVEQAIRRAITDPADPAHPGEIHLLSYTQHRVRPMVRTLDYPFAGVWDMSCHHFDNMQHWLGPIARLTGFAWRADWSPYAHPNNTAAHLRFANGVAGHYLHTHDAARNCLDVEIHGSRGALVLRDGRLTFNERPLEQFGTRPLADVPIGDGDGERALLRDFHAYVAAGREPGISVRHNLEVMAACEMFVRSATDGRAVDRGELDA